MPTLSEIINDKLDRLDDVPEAFNSAVKASQQEVLRGILVLIGSLDVKDGIILTTTANFVAVQAITNQLGTIVFATSYHDALITFAGEYNTQAVLNQGYFTKILGEAIEDKAVYQNMLRVSQADSVNLLNSATLQTNLSPPIKNILLSGVSNNQSFSELVLSLNTEILGTPERDGSLLHHTKQLARDAFNISDSRYTNIVAEDLNFEWFQYSRGTVKDTRKFCLSRQGKFYHKTEVELWPTTNGSFEANPTPRGKQWQGRNPTTDSATIWYLRGGFNCLHTILPVLESQVPKEVLARI